MANYCNSKHIFIFQKMNKFKAILLKHSMDELMIFSEFNRIQVACATRKTSKQFEPINRNNWRHIWIIFFRQIGLEFSPFCFGRHRWLHVCAFQKNKRLCCWTIRLAKSMIEIICHFWWGEKLIAFLNLGVYKIELNWLYWMYFWAFPIQSEWLSFWQRIFPPLFDFDE